MSQSSPKSILPISRAVLKQSPLGAAAPFLLWRWSRVPCLPTAQLLGPGRGPVPLPRHSDPSPVPRSVCLLGLRPGQPQPGSAFRTEF